MTAIEPASAPPPLDTSASPRGGVSWAMPSTECTCCGRNVRAYVPHQGDGMALVTYWHKHHGAHMHQDGWCRSEVDEADYPDNVEYYLYRRAMEGR